MKTRKPIHWEEPRFSCVRIPNSPTNRVYHYGTRLVGQTPEPITWFSDYGKHVYSSTVVVQDYHGMRKNVADRIRFFRKCSRR